MTNFMTILNFTIEISGLVLCLTGLLAARMVKKAEGMETKYPIMVFITVALALTSNLIGLGFRGSMTPLGLTIIPIANFCEFFFNYSMVWALSQWMLAEAQVDEYGRKWMRIVVNAVFITCELLLIVSQFTHMYYYIDEFNVYHRGSWWWFAQSMAYILFALDLLIIFIWPGQLTKRKKHIFLLYICMPFVASIIQTMFYGLFLTLFASSVGAFVVFMMMFMEQTEAFCAQANDLAEQRLAVQEGQMKLAMSQIQPHFLYNTLNTIYYLCDEDTALAQKALSDFSDYLRMNLSSAQQNKLISFEVELKHTETYLWLEQLRFGDMLKVDYQINTKDFLVPPLSLQPIVENAVKHGLGKKTEGGTITILTEDFADRVELSVIDDGVGFDISKVKHQHDRVHLGIDNVTERFDIMCSGKIEVQSEVGKGTTVKVILPKEFTSKYISNNLTDDLKGIKK